MRRCVSALSTSSDANVAFDEVCGKIDAEIEQPIAILFFAEYNIFKSISEKLRKKYPKSAAIGSTTYLNFINQNHSHTGFSALAIFSDIEVSTGSLLEIDRHPMNYVSRVHNAFAEIGTSENTCCIEFCTAFSNGEELVLDTFDQVLNGKGVHVLGGSGGVEDGIEETLVSLNGQVLTNACVFMFIHNLKGRIEIYKENIYRPTTHCFTATDVECEERTVYEFDGRPAADVMQEILGVPREKIMNELSVHPIGRMADNSIYITENKQVNDDGSILYFTRVYNMTKMVLLELDDIEKVWKDTRAQTKRLMSNPSFSFIVNCCGRGKTFESMNLMDSFVSQISEQYGTIVGFSGYGEQIDTVHLNQTLVIVMFE